jgi:hypothetical protein
MSHFHWQFVFLITFLGVSYLGCRLPVLAINTLSQVAKQ